MSPARYNFIMLFVGATMLAFLFLRPDPPPQPQWMPLNVISAEAVTHIRIDRALGEAVVLRRDNAGWILEGTHAGTASEQKAQSLAAFSQNSPAEPLDFSQPPNLLQFGLDPPRAILSLNDQKFVFGETNPVDGRRYLFFKDRIYLVSEAIFHHLLSPAAAFATHALTEQPEAVNAIELPGLRLLHTSGGWVDENAEDRQTEAKWWLQAKALSVRKADDSAAPGQAVVFYYDTGERRVFEILTREPVLKLRDAARGLRYEFTGAEVAGFPEP